MGERKEREELGGTGGMKKIAYPLWQREKGKEAEGYIRGCFVAPHAMPYQREDIGPIKRKACAELMRTSSWEKGEHEPWCGQGQRV